MTPGKFPPGEVASFLSAAPTAVPELQEGLRDEYVIATQVWVCRQGLSACQKPHVPGMRLPGSPLPPPIYCLLKHPGLGPGTVLRASGLEKRYVKKRHCLQS